MKTGSMKLAGVALSLVTLLSGCLCLGNAIIMPDRALESAVRAALNMPFGCLSERELAQITELEASSLGIQTLGGLEFCENLTIAHLDNNSIDSISELSSLQNVTFLDLSNNDISNLEPLAGLFFLQTLLLDGNPRILDWSALVANVENGGFQEGGTVVVGEESVQDDEGNVTPSFEQARAALVAQGVQVVITGISE